MTLKLKSIRLITSASARLIDLLLWLLLLLLNDFKLLFPVVSLTLLHTVLHAGADLAAIMAYLGKYFLIYPAVGPPVSMPAAMLGPLWHVIGLHVIFLYLVRGF